MNLKLDVVRLANEDVIATSACDKHPNAKHYYPVEVIEESDALRGYNYNAGDTNPATNGLQNAGYYLFTDINDANAYDYLGKWYYLEGNNLVECDGNHDEYTVPFN